MTTQSVTTESRLSFSPQDYADRYREVRHFSLHLCEPLATEDYVVQSMPDASPTKWHLAHTTWFFEKFLLEPHLPGFESPFPEYNFLFNSYYEAVGKRHPRAMRGHLTRPTVEQVWQYRQFVDETMADLVCSASAQKLGQLAPLLEVGLNHEQQHQELLLTDIKHLFFQNPLHPVYRPRAAYAPAISTMEWRQVDGGLQEIGFTAGAFAFDNESPRHSVWLEPYEISSRLATCGDWLEFMGDGGYTRPEYWLSAGWTMVQEMGWQAPLYWQKEEGTWKLFTLAGSRPVDLHEPVAHISYFEADAFARWSRARLPTEAEWEVACRDSPLDGNFVESGVFHPVPPTSEFEPYGNLWQWTRSQYSPYPGYEPAGGALGEYNGKFMCNQFVLRGGSCATSKSHMRSTYRNFFPPEARWQFSGLRLARDI